MNFVRSSVFLQWISFSLMTLGIEREMIYILEVLFLELTSGLWHGDSLDVLILQIFRLTDLILILTEVVITSEDRSVFNSSLGEPVKRLKKL